MPTDCAGCCTDEDCPCTKVCDETYCDKHFAEEAKQWKAYFDSYGEHARLMVMSDAQLADEMAEARKLK